jgi:hypothetical protein
VFASRLLRLYAPGCRGNVAMPETSQGVVMDFIERIFGFAPDGGSGSLEFLLFAIPIAGIAYLALRRRQRARRKQ